MPLFSVSDIHTYLWICHCQWEVETEHIYRYNHLGFDGEDYIKLDLEGKKIYIPQIQEAANDADSWNNTTDLLQHFLQFITDDCIFFLHKYLEHGRTSFNRTGRPIASYWSFLSFAVIHVNILHKLQNYDAISIEQTVLMYLNFANITIESLH